MILKVYLEYTIPVFISGLGVIQAAAAYNNLAGLCFFRQENCNLYFFRGFVATCPLLLFYLESTQCDRDN